MKNNLHRRYQDVNRLKEDIERILEMSAQKIEAIEQSLKKEKPAPALIPKSATMDENFLLAYRINSLEQIENLKKESIKKTDLLLEHLPEKQQTEIRDMVYDRLYPGQKAPEKPKEHFTDKTIANDFTQVAKTEEKVVPEEVPKEVKGRFSRFLKENYQPKEPANKEKEDLEPEH